MSPLDRVGALREKILSLPCIVLGGEPLLWRATRSLIMNPLTFFAHVALSKNADQCSQPEATANLLIEVDDETLRSGGADAQQEFSVMSDSHKVDFAGKIGRTAALDFLDLEHEFSTLPVRRFVDFDLTEMPCYMSVREAPTRTMPNHSKVWRLAQCESDKLRTEPLSRVF